MSEQRNICIVVGTRPNFIKVTQFKRVAQDIPDLNVTIVHSGQHYDARMAAVFFDQFGLRPDHFLDIPKEHPAVQIAETIKGLTQFFLESKPDLVMVVGDVNTTLAGAISANKCGIPLAHLESGLRSFDRQMPEEHNRKVADELANLHFITEDSGLENLRKEGKEEKGFAVVGNTMIDTLVAYKNEIASSEVLERLGLQEEGYALVTMHRPSNVDSPSGLQMLIDVLSDLASKIPVVFATHPRTKNRLTEYGFIERFEKIPNLIMTPPQGYFDFQKLVASSRFVLTDSGGIQEETTFLQKPCLTLRPNTERPVTINLGTNTLLPFDREKITGEIDAILEGSYKQGQIPSLWDGNATKRVLDRIVTFLESGN